MPSVNSPGAARSVLCRSHGVRHGHEILDRLGDALRAEAVERVAGGGRERTAPFGLCDQRRDLASDQPRVASTTAPAACKPAIA